MTHPSGYTDAKSARDAAADYILSITEMLDNLENATPSEQFDATLAIESMTHSLGRAVRARFDLSKVINTNLPSYLGITTYDFDQMRAARIDAEDE